MSLLIRKNHENKPREATSSEVKEPQNMRTGFRDIFPNNLVGIAEFYYKTKNKVVVFILVGKI